MQRVKLIVTCAMACTVLAAPVAAKEPRLAVTLRVVNGAGVPSNILRDTQADVARIMSWPDIDLIWLTCDIGTKNWASGQACSTELKPNEFWLDVTNYKPPGASYDLLGFTDFQSGPEQGQAAVFYPTALKLAHQATADLYQILAAAIAHEMGHLILGPKSHSAFGVMSPRFEEEQVRMIGHRWLRFTSAQNKLIQSEVRRRALGMGAQAALGGGF